MQAHPVLHRELRVRLGNMHPVNVFIHVCRHTHVCPGKAELYKKALVQEARILIPARTYS